MVDLAFKGDIGAGTTFHLMSFLKWLKELNLNNRLIHHLFIVTRKIANEVPKGSGEQYLSKYANFMHECLIF